MKLIDMMKAGCLVGAIFASVVAWAGEETVGGRTWSYQVNSNPSENGVTVMGASPAYGAIAVPSSLGGYVVRKVLRLARSDEERMGVTSIAIPDSVTVIADHAFANYSNLTSVAIGNGVRLIGAGAFWGCSRLAHVTIPNSVTDIGNHAFHDCIGLASVAIGSGVTRIGQNAFVNCERLAEVVIPGNVEEIDYQAFMGCCGLKQVTIEKGVARIDTSAFRNCVGLKRVTIGEGVAQIGNTAFSRCSSLAEIVFKGDAPSVGSGAFRYVPSSCVVRVPRGSTGWGVEIPGTWQGLQICYAEEGEPVVVEGVAVPRAWLGSYVSQYGAGDCEAAAKATGANGMPLWQSYVAGLDPTDAASRFEVRIAMDANGSPTIAWSPDLRAATPARVYSVLGKTALGDVEWTPVTDANRATMRFFKVAVEMAGTISSDVD